MKPGLSEDLIGINAQIKKNIDYVLGEKSESKNEKNNNDKEETYTKHKTELTPSSRYDKASRSKTKKMANKVGEVLSFKKG